MRRTAAGVTVLGFVATLCITTTAIASHQAYYDAAAAARPQGSEAAGGMPADLWNGLTGEQQSIHRVVTQLYTLYFERQGEVIPVNRETVALVMKELGIAPQHAEWTAYVMHANVERLRAARPIDSAAAARAPRPPHP
jgi:hypothetical protein